MKKNLLLKVAFFLGVLICFNANTEAQQIFISGTIRDAETNLFISDVNVSLKGTKKGVTTNKNGFFSIKLSKTETQVLTISHVTYQSLRANLSKELLKGKDSIELNLKLTAKAIEMTGISISAERVKIIQSEVLDFEINDSLVFVIERSLGKPTLSIYTFYDQLIYRRFLPKECNTVFNTASGMLAFKKEGAGNFYSLSYKGNDSYLTNRKYDSVDLLSVTMYLKYFQDYYFPSRFSLQGARLQNLHIKNIPPVTVLYKNSNIVILTFLNKTYDHFTKYLIRITMSNSKAELIYLYDLDTEWLLDRNTYALKTKDLSSLDIADYSRYLLYFLNIRRFPDSLNDLLFMDNVQKANMFYHDFLEKKELYLQSGNRNILMMKYTAVYFARMQNSVCIFNLINGKIYHLDSTGLPFRFVNTDSVFIREKSKNALINQEQTMAYVQYEKRGKITLREIDVMTGKEGKTIVLEHPFVEKIRIANNDIYYTYKDHTSRENYRRCLYKQRME